MVLINTLILFLNPGSFLQKIVEIFSSSVLLAWLVQRMLENSKKPDLSLSVQREEQIDNKNKRKFINVIVKNRKRSFPKSILFGNTSSDNMKAEISFFDFESGAKLCSIAGRWNSLPEPLYDHDVGGKAKVDVATALTNPYYSLPIEGEVGLPIVVKSEISDSIFGFNNQSYLHRHLTPEQFEIGNEKRYLIEVRILANGHSFSTKFVVSNPRKGYKNISLSPVKSNLLNMLRRCD